MKKTISFFLFSALLTCGLIIACSKNKNIFSNDEAIVKNWTTRFLNDPRLAKEYFRIGIAQFKNGVRYKNEKLIDNSTAKATLDSAFYYENSALEVVGEVQIMAVDSGWISLSDTIRKQIFQSVGDSITNPSYVALNPTAPIVVEIDSFMNNIDNYETEIIAMGRTNLLANPCNFTWGEVGDCFVKGAIAGLSLVPEALKVFRTLSNLSSWSYTDIFGLALSAVKEYVPFWKVLSIVASIAYCLFQAC